MSKNCPFPQFFQEHPIQPPIFCRFTISPCEISRPRVQLTDGNTHSPNSQISKTKDSASIRKHLDKQTHPSNSTKHKYPIFKKNTKWHGSSDQSDQSDWLFAVFGSYVFKIYCKFNIKESQKKTLKLGNLSPTQMSWAEFQKTSWALNDALTLRLTICIFGEHDILSRCHVETWPAQTVDGSEIQAPVDMAKISFFTSSCSISTVAGFLTSTVRSHLKFTCWIEKSTVPYQVSAYSLRTALRLPRSARDT